MKNECQCCGMMLSDAGEFHPWIVCALFRAGHSKKTIKANMNTVLDHGRRLERQGLPNDAPIRDVKFD